MTGRGIRSTIPKLIAALQDSVDQLNALMGEEIEADISKILDQEPVDVLGGPGGEFASALDPGFHARALGIATEMVSDATLAAAGAPDGGGQAPRHGTNPPRATSSPTAFRTSRSTRSGSATRCAGRWAWPWRWRSSKSPTSHTASGSSSGRCRCCGRTRWGPAPPPCGPSAGRPWDFLIGSAIMIGVSDHLFLLWFLLPIAVLVSGAAPAMISFAAGQAGFTVVVDDPVQHH